MKTKLGLSIVAALVSATAAGAADLPAPRATYVAAPPAVGAPYNWTGFYLGADVGYGWGKSTYNVDSNGFHAPLDPKGAFGGVFLGYNFMAWNNFVVGVEGDANFSGIKRSSVNGIFGSGGVDPFETFSSRQEWNASARLRLGYAIDRLLPFITGGVAFADYKHSAYDSVFPTQSESWRQTRVGGTIGAGLEYAITDQIAARIEYRYTDFGSKSYGLSGNGWLPHKVNLSTNDVRIGVSYKFN